MKKLSPEQYRQNRENLLQEIDEGKLTLGQFIRKARKALGKTQIEYAQIVNIDPKVLSLLENDKDINVTLKTIKKLLKPWGLKLTVGRTKSD